MGPSLRGSKLWITVATMLASLVSVLDISIVNVALPSITHALGCNQAALQWVINAYQRLPADDRRVSAARRTTVLAARSTNRKELKCPHLRPVVN